ncbi:MAG: hypothetical protein ACJARY_001550 [Candidatus Azotimanducaceae bacterium]|jgi:hypothetical protein
MIFSQSTIHIHSGFVIAGTNVQQARAGRPVFGRGEGARVPNNVIARHMVGASNAGILGAAQNDRISLVVALMPTVNTDLVIGVGVPSTAEVQLIRPLK